MGEVIVMDSRLLAVLVVVLVGVAVAGWMYLRKRRSQQLRNRFGPEYDRVVEESGDPRRAETELERREKRLERLHIRSLSANDLRRFTEAWRSIQAQFVDDPKGAVREADRLVGEVMQARGYPVADFEQRAADISVDHPHLVENYRAAYDIATRDKRGEASTEDLRQALVYYRGLFEELLEVREPALREVRR
jgi:hypothetical protein